MVEVKKILYPVDFFESSDKVLPYVKLMAKKTLICSSYLLYVPKDH